MLRNVRLDPQVDQSEILDRVTGRVNAADNTEALALVDILAQSDELRAKSGKGKVEWLYEVTVASSSFTKSVSGFRHQDMAWLHLNCVTAALISSMYLATWKVYSDGSAKSEPVQARSDLSSIGKLAGRAGASWPALAARAMLESPAIGAIAAARTDPVPSADIVMVGFPAAG